MIEDSADDIREFTEFEVKLDKWCEKLYREEEEIKEAENILKTELYKEDERSERAENIKAQRAKAEAAKKSLPGKREALRKFNIPLKRQVLKRRAIVAMKKLDPHVMRLVRHQRTAEHLNRNLEISDENIQLLREIRKDIHSIAVTLGGFSFRELMDVTRYLDEFEASRLAVTGKNEAV